ncbi:hypothetical protein, partial [Faecalibaculum rodentium]|uniref:hypothetical protein n=1 Tax=Faecalibaculum rodentium TaxID=1702221 RepID=UPI00272BFF27
MLDIAIQVHSISSFPEKRTRTSVHAPFSGTDILFHLYLKSGSTATFLEISHQPEYLSILSGRLLALE